MASKSEMPFSSWTMISPSISADLQGELGGGLDNPLIGSGPVPVMPGEGPNLALVDNDQGAVAVMLNLVNSALAGGWFRHKRGDFGLMKPRGENAKGRICGL